LQAADLAATLRRPIRKKKAVTRIGHALLIVALPRLYWQPWRQASGGDKIDRVPFWE